MLKTDNYSYSFNAVVVRWLCEMQRRNVFLLYANQEIVYLHPTDSWGWNLLSSLLFYEFQR